MIPTPLLQLTYIRATQRAVLYRHGDPLKVLEPGWHLIPTWPLSAEVVYFDASTPWIPQKIDGVNEGNALDSLIRSGVLSEHAEVIELGDDERALVFVDGRYARALGPGRSAAWTGVCDVRIDRLPYTSSHLEHPQLRAILEAEAASEGELEVVEVPAEHQALIYRNGQLEESLGAGRYGYWRATRLTVGLIDLREQVLDIAGQELMTSDKVTLRLNASLGYRVVDAERVQNVTVEPDQALYREAQLALRSTVGSRELEDLLGDRESVADELRALVAQRAMSMGLEVTSLGIRDVILPGEMKMILNRVMEAKRSAEANLITRREETAAMRSQANTAKMLESNSTLMRMRELEVLEKIADKANLQVVLSDGGLTDRLMKLV